MSKNSTKDRVVEKLWAYSNDIKERCKKDLEREQVETPSKHKGHVPLRLERPFIDPCPLGRKDLTFSKRHVTDDDMLRRVVASSSAEKA
jgi:hypothetical protein